MNQPVSADVAVTMSSLELVDFINSHSRAESDICRAEDRVTIRHDNLMAKVKKVLGKDALKFKGIYEDGYGREKPCYYFPKREACLMAMSYSYAIQAKVFDRMTELEQRQFNIPKTKSEALLLAYQLSVEVEAQQARLAVAEPKAEAFDELSSLDGLMNRRQAAKSLGVTGSELKEALLDKGWVFRKNGTQIECYSSAIRRGVVAQKNMAFGNYRTISQVLITNKGHALLKLHFVQNKSQQNLNLGAGK